MGNVHRKFLSYSIKFIGLPGRSIYVFVTTISVFSKSISVFSESHLCLVKASMFFLETYQCLAKAYMFFSRPYLDSAKACVIFSEMTAIPICLNMFSKHPGINLRGCLKLLRQPLLIYGYWFFK